MPATSQTNVRFADFNIIANGETANPLQKLLQEIDIIMTTDRLSLITNFKSNTGLERYLFKQGVNANTVADSIKRGIYANISTDYGYAITIDAKFLKGLVAKDILFVSINVDNGSITERLSYTIT